MRISEVDFILVPEWLSRPTIGEPDDDHWISRWHRNIDRADWINPDLTTPVEALVSQAAASARPTVIVTHGAGIDVLLSAGVQLDAQPVAGAFIVAPAPATHRNEHLIRDLAQFSFPSVVIAPDDHPDFDPALARQFADQLGGHFVNAGPTGRIDSASGQGPWPEGLMRLGWFLKQLTAH